MVVEGRLFGAFLFRDEFPGGLALAGAGEAVFDLVFVVGENHAAFLAAGGPDVEGFLTGAAVGGLGVNGHQDHVHVLGLAGLGGDGVAVEELAVGGRDNAAVFESDGTVLENLPHRDQFAVDELLTTGRPAVGAQKQLVALGVFDPEQAVLGAEGSETFAALEERGFVAENNHAPRFIAVGVTALGGGHKKRDCFGSVHSFCQNVLAQSNEQRQKVLSDRHWVQAAANPLGNFS